MDVVSEESQEESLGIQDQALNIKTEWINVGRALS